LEERPTVQHTPLALTNRSLRVDALADVREVFKGDAARSALGTNPLAL
jgi:hypothetical protein